MARWQLRWASLRARRQRLFQEHAKKGPWLGRGLEKELDQKGRTGRRHHSGQPSHAGIRTILQAKSEPWAFGLGGREEVTEGQRGGLTLSWRLPLASLQVSWVAARFRTCRRPTAILGTGLAVAWHFSTPGRMSCGGRQCSYMCLRSLNPQGTFAEVAEGAGFPSSSWCTLPASFPERPPQMRTQQQNTTVTCRSPASHQNTRRPRLEHVHYGLISGKCYLVVVT